MPRLLVTNDDGIDSVGLHVLARAMRDHGDVVVVAPATEHSGAGAALGALHVIRPEVRRAAIAGITEAWSVTGPPGLCAMLARLGVFGRIDLIVAGINPGANVGRAVYHSGTVGAAITARNGGMSGVAVSQAVAGFGVEGQGWDDMIADQQWDTAAHIGSSVARAVLAAAPADPVVVNVNVPNLPLERIKGWRHTQIGRLPPRAIAKGWLEPVVRTGRAVRRAHGVGRRDRAPARHRRRRDRARRGHDLVPEPDRRRGQSGPDLGRRSAGRPARRAAFYTAWMSERIAAGDAQLDSYRASIDNIDAALVHLLAERFKITQAVGRYKADAGMPPADPVREAQQIARLRALAVESGLDPAFTEKFLRFIVDEVIHHHRLIADEA